MDNSEIRTNSEVSTNSGNRTKLFSFISILCITIIALIYYYRLKIALLVSNPAAFLDLFLSASELKDFTFWSILTSLAIASSALIIDLFVLGWKNSSLRKIFVHPTTSSKIDSFCFFLSASRLHQALGLCVSLGIAYFLSSLFIKVFKFNLLDSIHIPWVQPIIFFVILDLKHYLEHRFMHIPKFWELHSYHHSATEMTVFTNARGHLLEASVYAFFTAMFFAIMGAPLHQIFWVYFFRNVYAYIIHSDIKNRLGWVGQWILISPPAHKLHHSINPEDYGRNFGTFFVWWDKILGTYKEPPEGEIKIGLTDNYQNEMNYFKGQWTVFKRWINSL